MEITKPIIPQENLSNICYEYKEAFCPYMDLLDSEGRYYPIKNFLFFKQDEYGELLNSLNILNNIIMKKTVFHLMERYKTDNNMFYQIMERIGFTKTMSDIMIHTYKKYNPNIYSDFPLTFFGRFDVLVDKSGNFKIVEQNSETPAGIPECINSPILKSNTRAGVLDEYVDVNEGMDFRMYKSFQKPIDKIREESKIKEVLLVVAFSNDNTNMHDVLYRSINALLDVLKKDGMSLKVFDTTDHKNKIYADSCDEFYFREMTNKFNYFDSNNLERLITLNKLMTQVDRFLDIVVDSEGNISNIEFTDGEDYNNGLHLASFFQNQFIDNVNVKVELVDVMDIEIIKDQGLFYKVNGVNKKIDYMYSFYPIEWFFLDDGAEDFWKLFQKDQFSILNNPLTLITQSKAFWAYLFENINDIGLTKDEHMIVKKYIPKYYFTKKENTISKPLFFREGSGINDDSFVGQMVYQEIIDQKVFTANEFPPPPRSPTDFDEMEGYLTIGLYYGEDYNTGDSYIGNYTRFCKNKITDFLAYYVPVIIGKKGNDVAP